MNASNRVAMIEEKLTAAFSPLQLEIIDDSHHHAGHASAGGGGHFTVNIISDAFAGKSLIERHRMVYAAMGEMMQSEIHALSINAKTNSE